MDIYEDESGQRYISLITERVEDDEIFRTGVAYTNVEIRAVDGKETIVLSDEWGANDRYVPLENKKALCAEENRCGGLMCLAVYFAEDE